MEDLRRNQVIFRLLLGIWFVAIFFSAVMYTLGFYYNEKVVIIISCITGLLSLIGIIYTGYSLIRIKNSINYYKKKLEIE